MSGIASSVGLVSGIPTGDLIDQLMAIESRSVNAVQQRVTDTETEKTAWMTLSAGLLALKLAATNLQNESTFTVTSANSSDSTIMDAATSAGVTPGTYQFTVRRLAQNHQMISTGFADTTSLVGAGTLTLDIAHSRLDPATKLEFLNAQAGVSRGSIRITDRTGTSADISLIDAVTVADVLDAINDEATLGVRAVVSGDSIILQDTTSQAGTITVAEVGSGRAAADLGLLGSATDADLVGSDINQISTDTSLDLLNDGNGIERAEGVDDLIFTLRDGSSVTVSLLGSASDPENTADTVGDVIDAINNADDNGGKLVASVSADGNGLTLVDTTGVAGNLIVANGVGSLAATQLGIEGSYAGGAGDLQVDGGAVIASLNSVLLGNLQGGSGVATGTLDLRDRLDNSASIDLSSASSVSDVIDAINNAGIGLTASLNDAGNGLKIVDTTGSTDFHMVVSDASGNLAATLGIAVDDDVTEAAGSNALHKYISTQTRLDDLVVGEDWAGGEIEITNSLGARIEVNVGGSAVVNLGDVIQNINGAGGIIGVSARLNDTGTGVLLEDSNGGAGLLTVSEVDGGKAARQLGLLGSANEGETFLDGSVRTSISIEAADTLADVVDKINDAGLDVTASIINDQTSINPYRLMLLSENTGTAGEIVFDTGATGLSMTTFAEARDALVYLGAPGEANSLALACGTNQLSDVVDGVTFDLKGTSDSPVTITIERDTEAITGAIDSFVESFNSVVDNIKEYSKFDPETLQRGVLFGDGQVSSLLSRLMNMVLSPFDLQSGAYDRFSDVGVTIGSGSKISFDADELLAAFESDRDSVISLFTEAAQTEEVVEGGETVTQDVAGTGGIGVEVERILDSLTDEYDGVITGITDGLDSRITNMNDRIDRLNDLLAGKRARYERQFAAMETAIARLQAQTGALTSLAAMAAQFSNQTSTL